MPNILKRLELTVGHFLGTGPTELAAKLRANDIQPDIVIPGNIAIDIGKLVIYNIGQEIGINLAEITDISIYNAGEAGFMDNYLLSMKTSRYDHPHMEWRISNVKQDADQAALVITNFISGVLMSPDDAALPQNIRDLSRTLATLSALH